ncbi:MAG: phosphatidylglycerol lysyltransferase domain-containing protein [Pseudomonadota bacterium]
MLDINEFKDLKLGDKDVFNKYYLKYPIFHSELSYINLMSWRHNWKVLFLEYKEHLILIVQSLEGLNYLYFPIGDFDKDLVFELIDFSKEIKAKYALCMISHEVKDKLEMLDSSFKFNTNNDYAEYVYLSKNLAKLEGEAYKKIRTKINKFNKTYKYTVEPISKDNYIEVLEFINRWCLWKGCEEDPSLLNEKIATVYSIEHFFILGLKGLIIRIEGEIQALSAFETLANDQAIIHYEKAIADFNGLYQIINNETAKFLYKDYKYLNRSYDMNLAGLRQAKKSYKPEFLVKTYNLKT